MATERALLEEVNAALQALESALHTLQMSGHDAQLEARMASELEDVSLIDFVDDFTTSIYGAVHSRLGDLKPDAPAA